MGNQCAEAIELFPHVQQDQRTKAIRLYKEATSQLERTNDQETLVITLSNLGKTQHELNRPWDAVSNFRKAIVVQSALLRASPANLNHLSRLGGLHNNLGFTWQRLGQHDDALGTFESAIEFQRRAFELAPPQIGMYRDALSRTYFNASRASLDAGHPPQAAELQLRRGELWPSDAEQLFSVASKIAIAIRRMPNNDASRRDWRRAAARTLRKALAADKNRAIDSDKAAELARFLGDTSILGSAKNKSRSKQL